MDWLFENIGKLLPVIIAIIYMIGSAKSRSDDEEEVDPAAAERARKIQEEIRRKILERQRGAQPQSPSRDQAGPKKVEAAPVLREKSESRDQWHPAHGSNTREVAEAPSRVPAEEGWQENEWGGFNSPASIYQQQEDEIEAKLAKARELRDRFASEKSKKPVAPVVPRKRATSSGSLRSMILSDLRDKRSTRRAILLKEILDTPVGLR